MPAIGNFPAASRSRVNPHNRRCTGNCTRNWVLRSCLRSRGSRACTPTRTPRYGCIFSASPDGTANPTRARASAWRGAGRRALRLPPLYAITNAAELGAGIFVQRLETALVAGLKLVQVREKALPAADRGRFARAVVACCREHGARVLVNSDLSLAERVAADGVHLTSAQLRSLTRRPACPLVGASCHDAFELERAAALDADFAVLGPVQLTKTHPDAALLGWERFRALATGRPMPVYALGGLRPTDLARAGEYGAHGIALQRAAW